MNEKIQILLIDDEPDILYVLRLMLSTEGFEVSVAENGAVALEKIATTKFDVVVCDYMMPKMDGPTILRQVREKKDYTPFIFFSGLDDENLGAKMIGLGAYEFLPKSHIQKLIETLKKTVKYNEAFKNLNEINEESDDFLKLINS
ncbi:MAG: response regulator [Bdellovibrionales bacterium]|nr:response regulator [Bdellovibrionales bacterium]